MIPMSLAITVARGLVGAMEGRLRRREVLSSLAGGLSVAESELPSIDTSGSSIRGDGDSYVFFTHLIQSEMLHPHVLPAEGATTAVGKKEGMLPPRRSRGPGEPRAPSRRTPTMERSGSSSSSAHKLAPPRGSPRRITSI